MALFGPFYAGKNAPVRAPWKRKTVKSVGKATPILTKTSKCSLAAKQLAKCRATKGHKSKADVCKAASKTLASCRKKKF